MRADPRATYRVQLRAEFGFDDAADIAGYLDELGVSHLYTSPSLQAAAGSTHGYDVADPTRLNQELGGDAGMARLDAALRRHRLGQLLDIVPNHMSTADARNRWWWDVLEDGARSPQARFFDVDWEPPQASLRGRVLLPQLGDQVGRVVAAGELGLERRAGDGRVVLRYHDVTAPVALPTLAPLLAAAAAGAGSEALAALAVDAARLDDGDDTGGPPPAAGGVPADPGRARQRLELWTKLAQTCAAEPATAAAVDAALARLAADPAGLDRLLRRQRHRLAFWRTAGDEVNWRRFFSITTLAAVRVEDPPVFDAVHALPLRLLRDGVVDGLRIDHVDGLRDPLGYLRRLADAGGSPWVVVEKILAADEHLPEGWPVAGTTGYEFGALATGLFVDPAGEAPLTALLADVTGEAPDVAAALRTARREVMDGELRSDVDRLVRRLRRICDALPRHRDHTDRVLRDALCEVVASLGVYRTYVRPEDGASAEDERRIGAAVAEARAARPDLDAELLGLVGECVLLRAVDEGVASSAPAGDQVELSARLQQTAAAAMAKGVEDTAFYRLHRLVALNEVGSSPARFGVGVDDLHRAARRAQRHHPHGLLATSTHDTKRSEDVRARLGLLSEIPEQWGAAVRRWMAGNERHRRRGMPDRGMEYLLYQTLVGAHPLDRDRALAYIEKASREAKLQTSWTEPDAAYDRALRDFVEGVLGDGAFVADLDRFAAPLVDAGRTVSLAQTLLKLTFPGIPDIYQGAEVWDLSLVDPDNRRAVDYGERRRLLRLAATATVEEALAGAASGLPKLMVVQRALALRRGRPELFGPHGAYHALTVSGPRAAHCVAFARGAEPGAVSVLPRLTLRLPGWDGTTVALPSGGWRDQLSGEEVEGGEVEVARLLGRFPVALLARTG